MSVVLTLNDKKDVLTLADKPSGQISRFTDDRIASKLMSMGVLPGSNITLMRRAPFGGGWYAKVDNLILGLRQKEVDSIVLK